MPKCKKHEYVLVGYVHRQHSDDLPRGYYCRHCGKPRPKKWMQSAFGTKEGALHKQLGVPLNQKIPKTLLRKLNNAKQGSTIKNPTKTGKKKIKVTHLVKQRINPVITANYPEMRRKR